MEINFWGRVRRHEFELQLTAKLCVCFSQPQSWMLDPGSALCMVSATNFHILTDMSQRYLMQNDFGVPEVESVMVQIFSTNCIGGEAEAEAWIKYWKKLNIYEEWLRDSEGVDIGAPPQVCFLFIWPGILFTIALDPLKESQCIRCDTIWVQPITGLWSYGGRSAHL